GAEYRISYGGLHQISPVVQPGTAPGSSDFKATGFNFLGAGLGLHARPDADTELGLAYRTRVVAHVSGTVKTSAGGQTVSVDGETSLADPDRIALGGTR